MLIHVLSSPSACPTDFDFLKVIGKGNYGKVSGQERVGLPFSRHLCPPPIPLACAKRELTFLHNGSSHP